MDLQGHFISICALLFDFHNKLDTQLTSIEDLRKAQLHDDIVRNQLRHQGVRILNEIQELIEVLLEFEQDGYYSGKEN